MSGCNKALLCLPDSPRAAIMHHMVWWMHLQHFNISFWADQMFWLQSFCFMAYTRQIYLVTVPPALCKVWATSDSHPSCNSIRETCDWSPTGSWSQCAIVSPTVSKMNGPPAKCTLCGINEETKTVCGISKHAFSIPQYCAEPCLWNNLIDLMTSVLPF